jgi:hypothetical protein
VVRENFNSSILINNRMNEVKKKIHIMSKLLKTLTVGAVSTVVALSASFAGAATYNFSANLTVGSRGEAVRQLQWVLNQSADTQVSVVGAGSPGNETTYFGAATKAAVMKFQAKNHISPVSGYVGPLTRSVLNNWSGGPVTTIPGCGNGAVFSSVTGQPCNGSVNPPANNGSVSASLAADNTPARSVVLGQASAELARFAFNGNGTVTNLKLQQIGLSAYNNTLQNVYLYDGATRLTDSGSVSSNGLVTFNNPSGLFTVGGSRTITVRADLTSTSQTGTVGVQLTGFTANGVSANAAISGNLMSIVNVTTATAAFTSAVSNPAASATVQAGTNSYTVWSNQINVSTRAVWLKAATFRYVGSAPATSLSNIKLFSDGVQVGTVGMSRPINGSNYIVFDLTGAPVTLTTGSHVLEVRADVVGGASYNFTVSVQNASDLLLEDSQLPGVFVSASGVPTYTAGNSVTIQQGTNSVTVDPAFTTTTVTGGATNVPIAQFKFTGYGEDVKITSLKITPAISGGALSDSSLNNVALYANGAQIGSTANFTGSTLTFNLGSSLIIPAGQSVILTVKADLIASSSVNQTQGTLTVALLGVASNAEGQSSHQIFAIPGTSNTPSTVTSNALTIGSNTITVAKNTSLADQTIAPNTANVKIGSFAIQAGSSEGVQVTNLTVGVSSYVGGTQTLTNLSNLKVVGNGITVVPLNPQATNNFSTNFSIATSQSQIVDVYADVGASSGSASTTLTVTGRGTVSNVSTTTTATAGQTITIAQGTVATTTVVSSGTLPSNYQIGPSTVPTVTYRFVSTTSAATIEELRFTTTGTSGAFASIAVVANGVTYPAVVPVGTTVTIAGLNIPIPAGNTGVNVVVVPTYGTVASTGGIASGSTGGFYMSYMKVRSGNTSTATTLVTDGNTASQTQTLVAAKPSLVVANSGAAFVSGVVEIGQVKITAVHGAINIDNIPLTILTSGTANASSSGLLVKNAAGTTITTATTTVWGVGANTSASGTISFLNGVTTGYTINAGTTETFRIFATVAPGSGTGANVVSMSLGAPASFTWTDLEGGGTEAARTGTLIQTDAYPSNSASIQSGS